MLTFRKALIVAAIILTCVYFFDSNRRQRTPKHAPQAAPTSPHFDYGSKGAAPSEISQAAIPTAASAKPTATPAGGEASRSSSGRKADDHPDVDGQTPLHKQQRQGDTHQTPMKQTSDPTLLEQLQYQYPYEPEGKFPAYIWQTWKVGPGSGFFDEKLRPMEASWSGLHPGFVHEVITDELAPNLVRYLYASVPEVIEAYEALPIPVLRADFFRYLILLARGGIYSDVDTTALKSAVDWLPSTVSSSSVGLIVGIEADPDRPDWAEWYSRRIQFCQWTIQAKAGHPVLRNIVAQITRETLRMKREGHMRRGRMDQSIVEFTGPARWTDVIFAYFNDPEYFNIETGAKNISWEAFTNIDAAKRVGDVVVLPITSFSPGIGHSGAKEPEDPMAFVKHEFEGSWKESWEQVKPIIESKAEEEHKASEPTTEEIQRKLNEALPVR